MSLLAEIQAAATDPAFRLSDLLRRCRILASRLGHEPFKQWVGHELNGYPDDAVVPIYRGPFWGQLKADVRGVGGGGANNVMVPTTNIPAEVRDEVLTMTFSQSVGMLEGLITDAQREGESFVSRPYSAELAAATPVWRDHQTMAMRLEVPVASVIGVLDAVRTRALEFTLEIEAENPLAGEAAPGSAPPVPIGRADVIFNTTIYGGQNAVGPGATVNVAQGDLGSLMAYLESIGVSAEDRQELDAALAADRGTLGSRVKGWLGEMTMKAVASGGRISESAAGGLIAVAVARFLGLA